MNLILSHPEPIQFCYPTFLTKKNIPNSINANIQIYPIIKSGFLSPMATTADMFTWETYRKDALPLCT
ncbi:hypothetical protein BCEP4_320013 [Burkholderia cepacia]|nr:hypothetical protein BCEP4_320013 [Burkholderia cepacia]